MQVIPRAFLGDFLLAKIKIGPFSSFYILVPRLTNAILKQAQVMKNMCPYIFINLHK